MANFEKERLRKADNQVEKWRKWGPYVSERAWGTVREDYSPDGSAWNYFPFEHSHLRAYRWNEDGIAGICDFNQILCFSVALWNGKDPILKERLFGLTGPEGNHGEDVKEAYFYLDNTPTHSYMKYLYKYPQREFPYETLKKINQGLGKNDPEFEIHDAGVFKDNKYFDVFVEYAKASVDEICVKITAANRGKEAAEIHLLPTFWFRNTWTWNDLSEKPEISNVNGNLRIAHETLGEFTAEFAETAELLFCENETNFATLYGGQNKSGFAKDGINQAVANGKTDCVNAEKGTKAAAHFRFEINGESERSIYLRLRRNDLKDDAAGKDLSDYCAEIFAKRSAEADEFYASITPKDLSPDAQMVMRQSLAGMLWSKQFYHFVVRDWLEGDKAFGAPPAVRKSGRNAKWTHLYNEDVISMPDKWEYPWYAAWDLAFHCIPLAMVDATFAKRQLILLLREWYMHPNGQIPAYEWAFGDVNPPVHAWAALRVYQIDAKHTGKHDRAFLEKIFHKLLLNFTWWINRKDEEDNNVFEGGFLGLDNIGVFDRSAKLPTGGFIEQSDGTSWMAMYCLNLLAIALELAKEDSVYEDVASKFFEHFVHISDAMNNVGGEHTELWNERDGFYYDVLRLPSGDQVPIKLRSMVGLIPLFAVETIDEELLERLPNFKRRTEWFLKNRPDLTDQIQCLQTLGRQNHRIMAIVNQDKLRRILSVMLSENEFLSDYGIRALSRFYKNNPFVFNMGGNEFRVDYEPAESHTGMFGGNSNWRGPIWFPVNYLLIESLQKFDWFYGDSFKIEFPTGSGKMKSLWEVSQELSNRLANIFLRDGDGNRPVFGGNLTFQTDEHWRDHILFYEYFHGDNGRGVGANHQTGWTGLIAKMLQQVGEYSSER